MKEKLEEWEVRLNGAQAGHYMSCEKYQRLNNLLGIPLVILSSFVSAFLFFENVNWYISLFLKISGVIVVILASLQTFIRPSEKAEMHRVKASKYGSLKRKVEVAIKQSHNSEESQDLMTPLLFEWNTLAEDAPVTPHNIRKKIKEIIKEDFYKKK